MKIAPCCCPELLQMDEDLFWYLFRFLEFGEDLDDMIFFDESYSVSER